MGFFPALRLSSLCRGAAEVLWGVRRRWKEAQHVASRVPRPAACMKHHKKRQSVHTLSLNIKRRIIRAEKEAVEKRDSPSIEWVRWRGEWTSVCCYTALPSLRSNCILGETLSLDLGESPRLRGLVCLRDLTGVLSAAFWCLLVFLNMVRRSFWTLVCSQPVWLNGHPLTARPPLTLPCGSCVCWWCCSPCGWCWGFPKIFTVPTATAVLLGCRELIGVSGRLKVLDFGKVSRLGGTPTADETNAPPSSKVSTETAARWEMSNKCFQHMCFYPCQRPGQENLFLSRCNYLLLKESLYYTI